MWRAILGAATGSKNAKPQTYTGPTVKDASGGEVALTPDAFDKLFGGGNLPRRKH